MMRSCLAVCCLLAVTATTISSASAKPQVGDWLSRGSDFVMGAVQGSGDMYRAYSDMREANYKNSDRYFHARGNSDAARRGAGGRWAAETISDGREWIDRNIKGDSEADSARDQAANLHGRSGKDPNVFRPEGLPSQF